jgi:hypothetical protein
LVARGGTVAAVLTRTSKAVADQVLNSFSQGRSLLRTSEHLPRITSKFVPGSNVTKVNPARLCWNYDSANISLREINCFPSFELRLMRIPLIAPTHSDHSEWMAAINQKSWSESSGMRTLVSVMKSERPPEEMIVDAGFDRIERHTVASNKGAPVTAEIEVVVLDLRTPIVTEGIFRPNAGYPAAGGSAG